MRYRILLVEDNEATVELTQKELEVLGYEVLVARNGAEAVKLTQAELPDLVVMDIHMPMMNGFEVAALLKKNPRTRSIPILAATARAMRGDKEKCLASGCDEYLAKPFTHRALNAAIRKLLKLD